MEHFTTQRNYIIQELSEDGLIQLLEKEAHALAHAAYSLYSTANKGIVSQWRKEECKNKLQEEFANVLLVIDLLAETGAIHFNSSDIYDLQKQKAEHWYHRLKVNKL